MPKAIPMKLWVKYLESLGLRHVRTSASHFVYDNPDAPLPRPVIVRLNKDRDVPILHLSTSLRNMGLNMADFTAWLKEQER